MEYRKDDEVRPPAPVTNAPAGETEEVDAVAATLAAKLIHIVHRVALCSQVFGSTGLALVPGAGQDQGEHLGQTQLQLATSGRSGHVAKATKWLDRVLTAFDRV